MMTMFTDAHAHLTSKEDETLSHLLARALQANVTTILNVCCDEGDLERGIALAKSVSLPKIYTMAAVTPHDSGKEMDQFFSLIEKNAEDGNLVAIGEAGLDYHYMHAPKERQAQVLKAHFRLASKYKLPLVIHCREAFEDLFLILDEERKACSFSPDVMLHCFTGSIKEAESALERGWYISLSGCVTFPKSQALRDVASIVPLDNLLIETDSPYLAPQGLRGRPNEPAFIIETAKVVASIKNIPVEQLAEHTARNASRLFKL